MTKCAGVTGSTGLIGSRVVQSLTATYRVIGLDVKSGYAEYMTVPETYAYPIPAIFGDAEAATLLCAGAVSFRALKLANLEDGQRLGLMGFGGSAHIVLQVARHRFPNSPVFVFARDQLVRDFALQLDADWAGEIGDRAPEAVNAIIDTTPAWRTIVEALANLCPGGRLVINAIRKEDRDKDWLQNLSYHDHLWMEREIRSIANVTHCDIEEFLPLAAEIPIRPQITTYRLEEANQALVELKRGRVKGAKVLLINQK